VLCWDFPGSYVQLKAVLRVNPWILCAPNVMPVCILARSNQNSSHISKWLLGSGSLGILIP
jgi:hypothetical protein